MGVNDISPTPCVAKQITTKCYKGGDRGDHSFFGVLALLFDTIDETRKLEVERGTVLLCKCWRN